jgi:hypothetical protein
MWMPYLVTDASSRHHCHCHCRCLPLATTTTTVALWLHPRCLHHHCIDIGTAVTTVFPPPSSVIYLIVMSLCPLPSIVVRSSSFFTKFITISPLIPPSFVDCCFKRRKKPLLPTMVSLLSSWPSTLVGYLLSAPAHSRRFPWQSLSAVRCPHSRHFDVAVAVSSPCRSDAAGSPSPLRSLPNSCGVTHG